jgi:hypothetical protein
VCLDDHVIANEMIMQQYENEEEMMVVTDEAMYREIIN